MADRLKCPICGDMLDNDEDNVFDHIYYQHDHDTSAKELILATLWFLTNMNIDTWKQEVIWQKKILKKT